MCDVNDVWKVRESLTKEGCIHTEVLFIADRPGKKGGMSCFKILKKIQIKSNFTRPRSWKRNTLQFCSEVKNRMKFYRFIYCHEHCLWHQLILSFHPQEKL